MDTFFVSIETLKKIFQAYMEFFPTEPETLELQRYIETRIAIETQRAENEAKVKGPSERDGGISPPPRMLSPLISPFVVTRFDESHHANGSKPITGHQSCQKTAAIRMEPPNLWIIFTPAMITVA